MSTIAPERQGGGDHVRLGRPDEAESGCHERTRRDRRAAIAKRARDAVASGTFYESTCRGGVGANTPCR